MGVLLESISANNDPLHKWRSTRGGCGLVGPDGNRRLVRNHTSVGSRPIYIPLEDVIVENLDPPTRLEMRVRQANRGKAAGPGGSVPGDDMAQPGSVTLRRHAGVFEGIVDDQVILMG